LNPEAREKLYGMFESFERNSAMVAIHPVHYNFARIHKTLGLSWQSPLVYPITFGV